MCPVWEIKEEFQKHPKYFKYVSFNMQEVQIIGSLRTKNWNVIPLWLRLVIFQNLVSRLVELRPRYSTRTVSKYCSIFGLWAQNHFLLLINVNSKGMFVLWNSRSDYCIFVKMLKCFEAYSLKKNCHRLKKNPQTFICKKYFWIWLSFLLDTQMCLHFTKTTVTEKMTTLTRHWPCFKISSLERKVWLPQTLC